MAGVGLLMACGGDGVVEDDEGGGGTAGGALFVEEGPSFTCEPPQRDVDGTCIAPGVSDDGCEAGTVFEEGSCVPAGVPVDGCGSGFIHDGDGACEPVVPVAPCADGLMAVPGDTACRPVMDCGTGPWGNLAVGPGTIYVDATYSGNDGDGTASKPFASLEAAIAAASAGDHIALAAGDYIEDHYVNKPLTIEGVCPGAVRLLGNPFESFFAPLELGPGASGSVVRGVEVTDLGSDRAVVVNGATGVRIEQVRLTNNLLGGLLVQTSGTNVAEVTLQDSLVDGNREAGVFVWGAKVEVVGCDIRDTEGVAAGDAGTGVTASARDASQAEVTVRGSRIAGNTFFGVQVIGSRVTIEDTLVRDTQPRASDGVGGRSLNVVPRPDSMLRSTVTVRGSRFDRGRGTGLFASGADVTVENTVIDDVEPDAESPDSRVVNVQSTSFDLSDRSTYLTMRHCVLSKAQGIGLYASGGRHDLTGIVIRDIAPDLSNEGGRGLYLRDDQLTGSPIQVQSRGSVVNRATEVGVFMAGGEATFEGLVVRDTQASSEGRGRGVSLGTTTAKPVVTLRASRIERNLGHGIFSFGARLTLEGTVVRDTLPADSGGFGRGLGALSEQGVPVNVVGSLFSGNREVGLYAQGVALQMTGSAIEGTRALDDGTRGRGLSLHPGPTEAPTTAAITESVIRDNDEMGIYVLDTATTVHRSIITTTRSVAADGPALFGDAIVVDGTSELTVTESLLARNQRAAILYLGGQVALGDTALACHALPLVDGSAAEQPLTFEDLGGVRCGCDDTPTPCRWATTQPTVPVPLEPGDANGDSAGGI